MSLIKFFLKTKRKQLENYRKFLLFYLFGYTDPVKYEPNSWKTGEKISHSVKNYSENLSYTEWCRYVYFLNTRKN